MPRLRLNGKRRTPPEPRTLDRPLRVSLFTDTLVDVNGVSRFIQNVAEQAAATGRDLEVVTSTRREMPESTGKLVNVRATFSTPMPKYPQLDLVIPSYQGIKAYLAERRPDVVHLSTPGAVGLAGWLAARKLNLPVLGVYHTDFPAYIEHFFNESGMTRATEWYMRRFYKRFSYIFTRSQDYVQSLTRLGLPRERLLKLMPGLETAQFNTGFRDMTIWDRLEAEGLEGISKPAVRVVYVGRVSVEKNLPLLKQVWARVSATCKAKGLNPKLIVVGDGPYRKIMEEDLKDAGVYFLGFRYGKELSTIYAGCDLFAFPSVTDTLGQVVMEAQSSGLAVLVTDKGGPKEVVEEGRTGFVIDDQDVNAWVDRLTGLIVEDDTRRAMGAAAAESMKRYDIRHSFEHFWRVHEEAWKRRVGPLEDMDPDDAYDTRVEGLEAVAAAS